ncbi:Hypothetical protein ING2D1G_0288 [Peptoniphilus sp. ING2-D1G]|nr:Hypothetical protein ING2D1G_0288 [Peptoniphilus sp. ING2-D1G]
MKEIGKKKWIKRMVYLALALLMALGSVPFTAVVSHAAEVKIGNEIVSYDPNDPSTIPWKKMGQDPSSFAQIELNVDAIPEGKLKTIKATDSSTQSWKSTLSMLVSADGGTPFPGESTYDLYFDGTDYNSNIFTGATINFNDVGYWSDQPILYSKMYLINFTPGKNF